MKKFIPLLLVLVAVFALAACQPTVADPVEVEVTRIVTEEVIPDGMISGDVVPYLTAWMGSGHADATAEAFVHWDEDGAVPASCAKCHSEPGYLDFVGADGTTANAVDAEEFPLGTTVTCLTCHNEATDKMDSVMMPSGVELTGLGDESRCMQCHQGRSSGLDVDARIEAAGVGDDETHEDLGFINIHYYAAAATKYGTLANGGYQYAGQTYDGNFAHVEGYDTCIDCHDTHTLEVKVDECAMCHDEADTKDFRMLSSAVDYDGDGDIEEGIYYEIQTLQEILLAEMSAYAAETTGVGIVYDSHAYPYFFNDTNGDGVANEDEASYGNQYASWTPRLMRAAYNYQVSLKDTGAYAHGGKYIIELLYDSIADLGGDVTALQRIDHGHFAGSEEAFRHWDEDGEVSGSCARCHSAAGLPMYLTEGVEITQEISNGFLCETCHDHEAEAGWPARFEVTSVTFPSGATISSEEPMDQFLCMTCHQGRASGADVAANIASENYRFTNVHYFAAGATRYGSEVNGMFEYDGKEYAGYFEHVGAADECTECHDAHELEVDYEGVCANCHELEDLEAAMTKVEEYSALLYAAMQEYAAAAGTPLIYDSHSYPYFFNDTDGDGLSAGPSEANYGNQFSGWDAKLMAAAYNYQYAQKDPGGFAHNGTYVLQALYDSIQDLGGDVSGIERP